MANSVSVNTSNKDLWAGGAEPYKASYGKLMMWFFLISKEFYQVLNGISPYHQFLLVYTSKSLIHIQVLNIQQN